MTNKDYFDNTIAGIPSVDIFQDGGVFRNYMSKVADAGIKTVKKVYNKVNSDVSDALSVPGNTANYAAQHVARAAAKHIKGLSEEDLMKPRWESHSETVNYLNPQKSFNMFENMAMDLAGDPTTFISGAATSPIVKKVLSTVRKLKPVRKAVPSLADEAAIKTYDEVPKMIKPKATNQFKKVNLAEKPELPTLPSIPSIDDSIFKFDTGTPSKNVFRDEISIYIEPNERMINSGFELMNRGYTSKQAKLQILSENLDLLNKQPNTYTRNRKPDLDRYTIRGNNMKPTDDPKQLLAQDSYTRGYDSEINGRMVVDPKNALPEYNRVLDDLSNSLEESIKRNKIDSDVTPTLYRGSFPHKTKINRGGTEIDGYTSALQVGDIYTPDSFLSTSVTKDNEFYKTGRIRMHIQTPKNKVQSGLYPNTNMEYSSVPKEAEMILPRKLKYRVDAVEHYTEPGAGDRTKYIMSILNPYLKVAAPTAGAAVALHNLDK